MDNSSDVAFKSTIFTENAHYESPIKFNEAKFFGDCF